MYHGSSGDMGLDWWRLVGFLVGFSIGFFSVGGMVAIYIYIFIICCGQYKGQRYVRSVVKWSFGFGGILVGNGQWWHGGVAVVIGLFGG